MYLWVSYNKKVLEKNNICSVLLLTVGTGARHLSCALVDYARESGDAAAARFFETNSTRAKVNLITF